MVLLRTSASRTVSSLAGVCTPGPGRVAVDRSLLAGGGGRGCSRKGPAPGQADACRRAPGRLDLRVAGVPPSRGDFEGIPNPLEISLSHPAFVEKKGIHNVWIWTEPDVFYCKCVSHPAQCLLYPPPPPREAPHLWPRRPARDATGPSCPRRPFCHRAAFGAGSPGPRLQGRRHAPDGASPGPQTALPRPGRHAPSALAGFLRRWRISCSTASSTRAS